MNRVFLASSAVPQGSENRYGCLPWPISTTFITQETVSLHHLPTTSPFQELTGTIFFDLTSRTSSDLAPFVRSEGDYIPEDLNSPAYSRTYMYAARVLKDFVCEEFRRFFDKYQEEIVISDLKKSVCFSHPSAKFCLEAALEEILYSSHPLYMLVDNYTAPFLHEHLGEDTKLQIEACLYKEFFCIVAPLVNHGRLDRVFIVGESVHRESKFNYGLGRQGQDCTTAAAVQEAFGFTAAQVITMSEALGIEKGEVVGVLRKEGSRRRRLCAKGN
ncbi:hypothetical protein ARMSODRAFT_74913 [Armillaria solidipes]|uniref:Uncharacterized protein n=1 Tax=Armillaria solidipes TaxID=1076256 RepID=A0A2H3BKQ2_9AGAR|nr:hypothetical protein ARMSODRAFT_74913 [Armillaria solidipes]